MSNHMMHPIDVRNAKRQLWDVNKNCNICSKSLPGIDKSTLDHIIPVCKGGSDDISNLQLVHDKCNNLKANHVDFRIINTSKIRHPWHPNVKQLINMINDELKRTSKKTLKLKQR